MKNTLRKVSVFLLIFCLLLKPEKIFAASETNNLSIAAQGAVVLDYETGEVLYEKEKDTPLVPASMTKVMTAYIIFEELESGRLLPDTPITISANASAISKNKKYPTAIPLQEGSVYSADTLLRLILIPSASACCVAMAEHIAGSEAAFVQRMNDTAKAMGIAAVYQNCHGALPNYITPYAQAVLTSNFIRRFPSVLSYTSCTSVNFNGKTYKNTNFFLPGERYFYPGADGFKTGTTDEAGYCLTSTAAKNGRRIISIVMNTPNNLHRYMDSAALLDYGFGKLMYPYPDIENHWIRPEVENLNMLSVDLTLQNGNFRPDEAIRVAEFDAMLYSGLRATGVVLPTPQDSSDSAQKMTGEMVQNRISQFYPLDFYREELRNHPENYCSRADAADMVNRLLYRLVTALYSPNTGCP